MKDPFNPTHAELDQWARTPDAMYPCEDWDLVVAIDENAELFRRLAGDPTCANRDAILNFLYVYAGHVVRVGASAESVAVLQRAITLSASSALGDVRQWATRAKAVLAGAGPSPRRDATREEYDFWFGCGWQRAAR